MMHLEQAYWPAVRDTELVETTVGALLRDRAAAHGEHVALVGVRHGTGATERLTYAELFDEASRVAAALSKLTPAGGGLVALWAPNVIEWPIIQYGAALAGMVLVALNPVLRDEELEYALSHSRAALLLHAEASRDYPMGEVARRVCARLPQLRRISLSESATWRTTAAEPVSVPGDPGAVAMLQYTSGTTGKPKGVALTHRALVNVARLTMEALQVPPAAVALNPLPMFHTAGCVIATLGPLWVGGTVVLAEKFVPQAVLDQLRREAAEVLFYVPTILAALLEQQRGSAEPAPRLRIIMGGASEVSPALIDGAAEVFGAEVFNLYGQTELAPVLTLTRPGDSRDDRLNTVGRPLPHVDCKIIDPDTQEVLPVGAEGEICARGYQQFVEYLHDPQATARALDRDGFVRTGDLGRMDERGFVTVTGRLKELIIRGGENIAPVAVEGALSKVDPEIHVVVLGLPDEKFGEIVAAVLCAGGGVDQAAKDRFLSHARDRLAAHTVPARWFAARDLPVTPTGKVQRFALRDAILRNEIPEI